jgi:hypothetical protein
MEETKIEVKNDLSMVSDAPEEAFASINLNPTVAWAKFILTDDLPNANHERVPEEEFNNLIKTGTYMPIKVAEGGIADTHKDAKPIGVIAHLNKVKNQILGLAALWERERPEDVNMIRERFKEGKPLQLSWEILYGESSKGEDGTTNLLNTALRAVTLVGLPAYEGRTPILAVASENTNKEETILDNELKTAQDRATELEASLAQKEEEISSLKNQLTELEELRTFKNGIMKEREEKEKLSAIKTKFSDSGLTKEDNYFEDNKSMLLSLSLEALDFMLQEMVAFSSKESNSNKKETIVAPPLLANKNEKPSISELAKFLREKKS